MSHAITIALISIYPWSEVFNQITFCFFTLNMSGLVCLGILLFFYITFWSFTSLVKLNKDITISLNYSYGCILMSFAMLFFVFPCCYIIMYVTVGTVRGTTPVLRHFNVQQVRSRLGSVSRLGTNMGIRHAKCQGLVSRGSHILYGF